MDGNLPGQNEETMRAFIEAARGGFSPAELDEAFDVVKDAAHWKNPIDAIVPRSMVAVLERAIPYYTGTSAEFFDTEDAEKVQVKADGYFLGPCN